jgi:hypothetical protein
MKDILKALGSVSTTEVGAGQHWTFYQSVFSTPAGDATGNFLYLKSSCPRKEGSSANREHWSNLSGNGEYIVVAPVSSELLENPNRTRREFGGKEIFSTREFLRQKALKDQEVVEARQEDFFIVPDLFVEHASNRRKAPETLTTWFRRGAELSEKHIGILVAHAGTGKTTLARHLQAKLTDANAGVFPILLESEQWRDIIGVGTSLSALWELAVKKSLRMPEKVLGNPDLFRTLVKEGVFPIIFDGLDELCLHPDSEFSAADVVSSILEEMVDVGEYSHARVLLTTRDSYWKTIEQDLGSDKSRIARFDLLGFSNDQKIQYFSARFKDEPVKRDYALRCAREIATNPIDKEKGGNADRISGTPFILSLIAYACEQEDLDLSTANPYEGDHLDAIVRAICERENRRQKLGIPTDKQIELFEELFHIFENEISKEDLTFYASLVCGCTPAPLGLYSHFFLLKVRDGVHVAKYDVLKSYFVARYLAYGLSGVREDTGRRELAAILAQSSDGTTQVMDWVYQFFKKLNDSQPGKFEAAVKKAVAILFDKGNAGERRAGMNALFKLLMRLYGRITKEERTERVLTLLSRDPKAINGLSLEGAIRGLDFRGKDFVDCQIDNTSFRECDFGPEVNFCSCVFVGALDFGNCLKGIKVSVDERTQLSNEAELEFARVSGRPAKREAMKELALQAMLGALKKFRGSYGFETINFDNKTKGLPHGNPFKEKVWEALEQNGVVERHRISGLPRGGLNVVDDPDTKREIWDFFDNGILGRRMSKVVEALT